METYKSEAVILPVNKNDLSELAEFIRSENNDPNINKEYLNWWYFEKPLKSFSLQKLILDNIIEGVASTNNYKLSLNNKNVSVAFPQKVLTSKKVRGKGFFNKLYFATEENNIENNTTHFLTFTNELSTPIFLKKFGYSRGRMPDLYFVVSNPLKLFTSKRYEVVENFNLEDFKTIYQYPNSIIKDFEYIKWRYFSFNSKENTILRIKNKDGSYAGTAFLKKSHKKNIPFYMVLDIIVSNHSEIENIVTQIASFVSRSLAVGMLLFDNSMFKANFLPIFHIKLKNRFNFLVKGQNPNDTNILANTSFNFFFGDLDFS